MSNKTVRARVSSECEIKRINVSEVVVGCGVDEPVVLPHSHPVFLCITTRQLDHSAQACPRGKYVWNLWASDEGTHSFIVRVGRGYAESWWPQARMRGF